MKRISGLIILVTIFAVALSGVSHAASPKFGIKALVGMSTLTGDIDSVKSMVGFGGGVLAQVPVGQGQFMVQPEALVVLKGAKEDVPDNAQKFKLTYIEIPVLLKYAPPMESTVKPSFFAGPALGVLLSAKIGDVDYKDYVKSTDFGIVFGAGVDFMSGGSTICLDVRYNLGLSNINDEPNAPSDFSVKNSMGSVNVSYLFGGGNGNGM